MTSPAEHLPAVKVFRQVLAVLAIAGLAVAALAGARAWRRPAPDGPAA